MTKSKRLKDIQGYGKEAAWRRAQTPHDALRMLDQTMTAFEMKLQGCTYADIATALDLSTETVRQRIFDELAAISAEVETSRETFRALELARLEMLQTGLWAIALKGDLDAVDRVLKIMDRRSKLLGLDQPVRIEIADWREEAEKTGIDAEQFFEWVVGKFTTALEKGAHGLLPDLQQDEPNIDALYSVINDGDSGDQGKNGSGGKGKGK